MGIPLRVLLIEDSEDDAWIIVRELKRAGYEVDFQRADSATALQATLSAHGWDLVISDFSMPGFSGTDALKLVRSTGSDAPFIFVSGTMGEDVAVAALKDGAQDYLIKTNLKRLVPAVQRELREAQERRQRKSLEQHVHQLQKFEAIGRLAGGIAHDFNNAIGAILGWAEMGFEEASQETRFRDRFQKIRDQAKWAGRLTSQLLAYARRQVLQPKKINLNALVEESMNLLRRIIGEQIEVRVVPGANLNITLADPIQVEQALMNLCLNARDAMPNGGALIIETRNVDIGEEYCRQHAYARPGNYVMLSVSDTGVGMDCATLEHVFEPFFTTKEMGKGTGLGLATVYGVVKQHEGFIYAYSEPGNGTIFHLYFPTAGGAPQPTETRREDQSRRGTGTILLADDHQGLRESATEMLESLGYRVIPATNGIEAVQLFQAQADQICLVILDVMMPGLSGPDTYTKISAIRPGIGVIFASGYSAEVAPLQAALGNGIPLLQKPYGLVALSQMVCSVLEQKSLA
jgi:two-component system cell cycle sensor histidine kinase/response regulator CckA